MAKLARNARRDREAVSRYDRCLKFESQLSSPGLTGRSSIPKPALEREAQSTSDPAFAGYDGSLWNVAGQFYTGQRWQNLSRTEIAAMAMPSVQGKIAA
jgi:hypothetical protein